MSLIIGDLSRRLTRIKTDQSDSFIRVICGLFLQLYEHQANCRVADVLGPVGYGVAVDDVAGFELAVGDCPVSGVVAEFAALDHIDEVRGMRVSLFFVAGLERGFEHANTLVLQLQRNCF